MTTISNTQDNLTARLFVLLSRWSLLTGLLIFASVAVFIGGIGFTATDSALGQEYAQLMQAIRSPVFYRLQTLFEALYWLMIGGTLIIYAGLFARRAPIRAAAIAACGIGQLTGSLGSFLHLNGVSDLAARYATAAPNQQAALLQSFLDLNRVIEPHYTVGTLLSGAGFLVVAWVAWRWMGFPRWLAVWLAIGGLLGLVLFILRAAGSPPALLLAIILMGVMVLFGQYVAMAVIFWRPSTTLVTGAVSESVATA